MKRRCLVSPNTALFLFFGALFMACASIDFADIDVNGNNLIDKEEFRTYFIDTYVDDIAQPHRLGWNDAGFYTSTYHLLDRNNDGRLSRYEWRHGYDRYYGLYLSDDYFLYDLNRDGYLSHVEYTSVLQPTPYFVNCDSDKNEFLTDVEFANAVFEKWDDDQNGVLDETEFGAFTSTHG